ncbi:hypothetical protein MMC14_004959 [Varicellaria rhodocarpa]|nr:hypothetical protein [Varicellaria rhodocarpa]
MLRRFPRGDISLFLPGTLEQLEYPGIDPSEADLADWEWEVMGYEKEKTLRGVFVRCGWDVAKAEEDIAGGEAVWERLEGARRAAGEYFDGALFQREKENWERRTYTDLQ